MYYRHIAKVDKNKNINEVGERGDKGEEVIGSHY